ncbi:MAG: hypothetical protein ACUVRC_10610 [Desulfotomaculales bacterium]
MVVAGVLQPPPEQLVPEFPDDFRPLKFQDVERILADINRLLLERAEGGA